MLNLQIPAGYTHQQELINRGWKSAQIKELLSDAMIKVEVPATAMNVSNKAYKNETVEAIETGKVDNPTAKLVAKAFKALSLQVPKTDENANTDNTVARSTLINQGWTVTLVKNYLGAPDFTVFTGQNDQHRYLISRVEEAKKIEKVSKTISKSVAAKTDKKEANISNLIENNVCVFRKHEGIWVIEGKNLTVGNVVTVTQKNGSEERKMVTAIISERNGVMKATFKNATTMRNNATRTQNVEPVTRNAKAESAAEAQTTVNESAAHKRNYSFIVSGDVHESANAIYAIKGETVKLRDELVTITETKIVKERKMGIDDDFYTATIQKVSAVLADANAITEYENAEKVETANAELIREMWNTQRNSYAETFIAPNTNATVYEISPLSVRMIGNGTTAYVEAEATPDRKIVWLVSRSSDGDAWGSYNAGDRIAYSAPYSKKLEDGIKLAAVKVK